MELEHVVAGGIAAVVVAAICAGAYNNTVDNEAIRAMVQKGADPIAAYCAIRPSEKMAPACTLLASKR